jgi:hypothetical protein
LGFALPHPVITDVTIPIAARLRGVDPSHMWRQVRDGIFGPCPPRGKRGRVGLRRVSIEAIERHDGVSFSPAQIEAATAPSKLLSPGVGQLASLRAKLLSEEKLKLRKMFEATTRNVVALFLEWAASDHERRCQPNGPQSPDFYAGHCFRNQKLPRLWSDAQVEEIIGRTVAARDADWERHRTKPSRAYQRVPDYLPHKMFDLFLKG